VTGQVFADRYEDALRAHLTNPGEAGREAAYELGRSAISSGLGVLDVATVHSTALAGALSAVLDPREGHRAWEFFSETLGPFEMALRGFREANASLRELNASLEQRVEERTRDFERTRDQLRHSQKMEALGLLAGGVAHDFNNLLAVILSYADLLATDGLADETLEDIDQIRQAARRAAELTRQLLAFGRRQVMQMAPLSVNAVVTEAEKMLRRILGEDVEIVTLLAPDLGLTVLDRSQLDQILLNLTVNARDAMPDGGKLTIETRNVDLEETFAEVHPGVRPGRYVTLSVTDTGCGMDEATRTRIFEPFFTTKDIGKGTGLGLATVHGIVEQSQGHIWVYSEPRHGTAFKLYFPRTDDAPAVRQPGQRTRGARHATILLVEDDTAVRGVAIRILESGGHRVVVSSDPDEALALADRQAAEVDLLLTDVVMPHMSGPELAHRFMKRWPRARVLFMSGYAPRTIVHHGLLDSGVALLEKPFTPASLLDKVAEVVTGEPGPPGEGGGR